MRFQNIMSLSQLSVHVHFAFTTISCGNTLLLRSSTGELSDLALLARPINSGRSSAAQHEKSGNVEVCRPVVRMEGTDLGGVFGGSDRGDAMNVLSVFVMICEPSRIPQGRTSRVSSALETANGKYDCALSNLASLPVIAGCHPGPISSFALSCMISSFSPPAFAFHIASVSFLSSLPKATNLMLDTAPPIIILTLSIARENVTHKFSHARNFASRECRRFSADSYVLFHSFHCSATETWPRRRIRKENLSTVAPTPTWLRRSACKLFSYGETALHTYTTYIATWVEGPGRTAHSMYTSIIVNEDGSPFEKDDDAEQMKEYVAHEETCLW
ncbi:uncharacterized protein B0T23DRAFT_412482 [Neurospora hispaniola]|uniref:Uncharacterized protein n=1 Tax=Neurospora hispaniola TaxID=588809 RepID=A0AAJ0I7T7_9PEZI|nr:hypothetical protein B0T23DRAFT_412482 [Neurospora hispaniola]